MVIFIEFMNLFICMVIIINFLYFLCFLEDYFRIDTSFTQILFLKFYLTQIIYNPKYLKKYRNKIILSFIN